MDAPEQARLRAAARCFAATAPWRFVADDWHFGVDDRASGLFGCACIMGNAGIAHGLVVQLGAAGFALLDRVLQSEVDPSTYGVRSDALCLIVSGAVPREGRFLLSPGAASIDDDEPSLVVYRLVPGRVPRALEAAEAAFLARCLEAVADLAARGRLGRGPARAGDRVRFFLLREGPGGKLVVRSTWRRIPAAPVERRPIAVPEDAIRRLAGRVRYRGAYLLSIFCPPANVRGAVPWATLLYHPEKDAILYLRVFDAFEAAAVAVFEALEGKERAPGAPPVRVPEEIWTDSFPVYEALKDALTRIGTRLGCREAIPDLARLRTSLADFLRR